MHAALCHSMWCSEGSIAKMEKERRVQKAYERERMRRAVLAGQGGKEWTKAGHLGNSEWFGWAQYPSKPLGPA